MVGAERFELPTLWSQTRCATRLRYAPNAVAGQTIPELVKGGYRKTHLLGKRIITRIRMIFGCLDQNPKNPMVSRVALGAIEKPMLQAAARPDAEFCRRTGNNLHHCRHFAARTEYLQGLRHRVGLNMHNCPVSGDEQHVE